MPSHTRRAFALCLTLAGTPALAQGAQPQTPTSAPQPSAGGTPERTPFGTPYGAALSHDQATAVLSAAEAEAKRRGWPTSIAVVDTHGELVAFSRADGAPIASSQSAQRKAGTAARWRRDTRVFFNAYVSGANYVGTYDPEMMAAPGGFPLVMAGTIIGAVGCGGGTGDQDALVCQAGADSVK